MQKRYTQIGFSQGHMNKFIGSILIEANNPESLDWIDIAFKVFKIPTGTTLTKESPVLNVLHPDEAILSQQPRLRTSDYKVWVLPKT